MKLRQFLDNLNKLVLEHPEALEMEVITSSDAEGNNFTPVHYGPSIGFFEIEGGSGQFYDKEGLEDWGLEEGCENSVCIN